MIGRITDVLVRAASNRWPDPEAMTREWRAELAHLRSGTGNGWSQLGFALSLACTPGPGAEVSWRARLPRLGPAATTTLVYLTVAWISTTLWSTVRPVVPVEADWPVRASTIGLAASLALMMLAGLLVGRQVPVAAGRGRLFGAVTVTLPMAVVLVYRRPDLAVNGWLTGASASVGVGVWFAAMTVLLALVGRWAVAGRQWWARIAGTIGLLATLDVATAVAVWPVAQRVGSGYAPLAFPLLLTGDPIPQLGLPVQAASLLEQSRPDGPMLRMVFPSEAVVRFTGIALPLLLCGVFALVATLRGARLPVGAVVTPPVVTGARTPAWVRLAGAGLVSAGALAWVAILHWHGFDWFGLRSAVVSTGLFAQIQRGALVLVGVGVAVLVTGRGPVAVPSLAAPLAMLAAVRGLHRWHLIGTPAAIAGALVVAAAVAVAWWLSGAAARALPELTPASPRRVSLFIVVLASLSIPGGFIPPSQPGLRPLIVYGIAATLGLTAAAAALAARQVPPRATGTIAVLALGLAAAVAGVPHQVGQALYWFDARFVLQVPLMIALVAMATPPSRPRAWLGWAATFAAAVAAEVLFGRDIDSLFYGNIGLALPLAAALCRRAPTIRPVDPALGEAAMA